MRKTLFLLAFTLTFIPSLGYASEYKNLQQEIRSVAQEIAAAGQDHSCESLYGVHLESFYRFHAFDVQEFYISDIESRASRCYSAVTSSLDTQIQRNIVSQFRTSKLACNKEEFGKIKTKLLSIIEKRKKLYTSISNTPELQKKLCGSDPDSQTFTKTLSAYNSFMERIQKIEQTASELSSGESEYLWTGNEEKISEKAKQNAQNFYNEFWGGVRSQIFRSNFVAPRLKSLPNGRSMIEKTEYFLFGPNTTEESKQEEKKILENALKQNLTIQKGMLKEIGRKENVEKIVINFSENIKKMHERAEKNTLFNAPLTQEIVNVIDAFQKDTEKTTQSINTAKKSLESFLESQNTSVGY